MDQIVFTPILANALNFAFEKSTLEGKVTIGILVLVSIFSWTVMIQKARQLYLAHKASKKFFAAYRSTRHPLDVFTNGGQFPGSPAFNVYFSGAEELQYHLKNNPVRVKPRKGQADDGQVKISHPSFESVKVVLERGVGEQSLALEKGMIILSTAVAGGPFIGLLGTVWGVMETFSGIAKAQAASLIAMAPGVAGALIATVVGLFVAIPAMFAYNYMITKIRAITQDLDLFTSEFATAIEHKYVDNRSVSDEIADALIEMRAYQD
jgi:biopolymer transport protein ExbB/TolQ